VVNWLLDINYCVVIHCSCAILVTLMCLLFHYFHATLVCVSVSKKFTVFVVKFICFDGLNNHSISAQCLVACMSFDIIC